jgi:small subunit ribosomal protein S2
MQKETTTVSTESIEAMFRVGAHFGYSRARRHASVRPYLYGSKNGVDIIDLEATAKMLSAATALLTEIGKSGKTVLLVGTKPEIRDLVEETAKEMDAPYVTRRWIGGTLTNWSEIKKRIAHLRSLTEKFTKGELEKYTKKERLLFERELEGLRENFGGFATIEGIPAALIVIDPRQEAIAVEEARKMRVPTVALMNSDCDAAAVTHGILANDAAIGSVKYFLTAFRDAYLQGKKQR